MTYEEITKGAETEILKALVSHVLERGYCVSVDTGGDEPDLKRSTDEAAIIDAATACGEAALLLYADDVYHGSFLLVFGNEGYTLIADHSVSRQDVIDHIEPVVSKWEKLYEAKLCGGDVDHNGVPVAPVGGEA